jgi:hypothetical protein
MKAEEFRRLALSLPQATEMQHMGHPDFRVSGKIFATLAPDNSWGMVKLTPQQQALFIHNEPGMFEPVNGGWGLRGATMVLLKAASEEPVLEALKAAWRNIAPKRLERQLHEKP